MTIKDLHIKTGKALFVTGIIALLLYGAAVHAQQTQGRQPPPVQQLPPSLMPPHPAGKMMERLNIDAKRTIEDINGEDALPRSREFIRTDSTYYVGYMFEGVYKYGHAADYLGFKNAIIPLQRAMLLLEHDYARALYTRTDNILVLYPIRQIAPDYALIVYNLMNCYSNTDQPDKVFALMRRTLRFNFQLQYVDAYNYMAWTVHRNRFYTSSKYPFLKNSIDDNEKLANRYLDSSLMQVNKNIKINEPLAQYLHNWAENERLGTYHYKNILYSYSFNIDSAMYYFDLLRKGGRLSHNNYANFLGICGDFKTADAEYKIASTQDGQDKRLQEWAYYTSILDIYKSKPKLGALLARNMIKQAGTTPGYGWYNIALARCMLYDGQVSEAKRYADRAAEFKEVHIGTTLGQSQYDFSIQLIKLINKEQEWEMERFEHSNWWYNPKVLGAMSSKLGDKFLQQFFIINQFSQNPERDRVIYKLFSTESTVSWDEIWYLVHDFSTQFFVDRFKKEAETDKRKYVRKYFELFVARLTIKQGKYSEAKAMLDKLLADPETDPVYERLYLARIYQCEGECAKAQKHTGDYNDWMYRMCALYPQLAPFCSMQANVNLHISGTADKDVVEKLKACNINWVTDSGIPALEAYVSFTGKGNSKNITYYTLDRNGNYVTQKQSFVWQQPEAAGTALAYRLFNIGGKEPEEEDGE